MPDRIYSEEEISTLLKRAAQIQHEQPDAETAGLNRAELERLAAEVGLEQHALAQALREMHAGHVQHDEGGFHPWGGPRRHTVTRTLGASLTDDTWQHIVSQLQLHHQTDGRTTGVGQVREWHIRQGRMVHVTAREVDGQTQLTLSQRHDDAFIGVYGGLGSCGVVFAFLLTLGATELPLGPRAGGSLLLLLACLIGAWLISRTLVSKRIAATDALMDQIERAVGRQVTAPHQAGEAPRSKTRSSLALDDLPEAPETAGRQEARRTRS